MSRPEKTITVGELKQHIEGLPDNAEIFFGSGDLTFYRVKTRGDDLHQIEFNELYEVE
ncbi:hypothetical protein [uncultured Desulfuromusa sp.]|uniref:hypothetical protein n=1 Tax=uncultured Desulfuromusa sp. TaxID=219183 RepID=UPI002AA7E480|nr:hypothetical protein [uncultured Desulfuromusa sp.]